MKWLLCVILAVGTQAFLFPSSGGGGCGGGCGGGTSSCLPSLGCSQMCFSIPTLKLPTPCAAPAAPSCGCGGKRKKRSIPEGATETCSDPKLRKIILEHIQNEPTESRTKIVSALHTEFKDERFLVACTSGSEQKFATSSDFFCVDGTPTQTCYVFALDHGEVAEEKKEEKAEDEPKENEQTEEEAVDDSKEEKDEPKSEDEVKEEAKEDSKEAEEAKDEAKEVEDAKDEEAKEAEEAKDEPEETKEEEKEEEKEEKEEPKEEEKEEDAKDEEAATEEKDE